MRPKKRFVSVSSTPLTSFTLIFHYKCGVAVDYIGYLDAIIESDLTIHFFRVTVSNCHYTEDNGGKWKGEKMWFNCVL